MRSDLRPLTEAKIGEGAVADLQTQHSPVLARVPSACIRARTVKYSGWMTAPFSIQLTGLLDGC